MRKVALPKDISRFRAAVARVFVVAGFSLAAVLLARAERLPIKIYTTGDGLAHNEVHRVVRDSRGFLWFCTFEGILITGLSIAGRARSISALGENEIASIELGAGENQLQIEFVALGFSPGEGLL